MSQPVFVVGVPRSGTTLLTAMLGAHSRMDCGPETQFFAHLRRANLRKVLSSRHWPSCGVAFVQSLVLNRTPVHELFELTPADLEAFLQGRSPTIQALLESLTAARAARTAKVRWVEKTPNHLLHVTQIRALYPEAPIIRILRDPRDVALSLRGVPFASSSVAANLYSWLDRDERSWRFFESDARSTSVRYEDLVSDPRAEMQRLCGFINEPFEESMLAPGTSAKALIGTGEWWKENVRGPIRGTRVQAWRLEFSEGERQLAAVVCAEPLQRYGYPAHTAARRTFVCQPMTTEFIERNEAVLIDLAGRGIRLYPPDLRRGLPHVVWGLPGQLRWSLGASTRSRIASVMRLVARAVGERARGGAVRWIAEDSRLPVRRGLIDTLCGATLHMVARRTTRLELFDESSMPAPLQTIRSADDASSVGTTTPEAMTARFGDGTEQVPADAWDTAETDPDSHGGSEVRSAEHLLGRAHR